MSKRRFYVFWAINDSLDLDRMRAQLDRMKGYGFDGVVFQPRFYPNQPKYLGSEYFEAVSIAILYAKSIGLSFWVYDENGWPSGIVDGEMLRRNPEFAQQWVGLYREVPPGAEVVASFVHRGESWKACLMKGRGVDYLNPKFAERFIELTYERYRLGLYPEAFEYVEAFFCDEPELGLGHEYGALPDDGAIPWTGDLVSLYQERCDKSLFDVLPGLFFRDRGEDGDRIQFWEMLRDRFCDGFLLPINEWCEKAGKRFAAHIKGEEHPLFQVPMVGSCQSVYRNVSLPGIDALERYPSNNYFPRQLASSALQFGDGRCMVEAFGGAGWGAKPEDLERYLLWLGEQGISHFVLHLWQYRLDSDAIRDWPASIPLHLNWEAAFGEVLQRVRERLDAPEAVSRSSLMVSPHRALMAKYEPRELLQTNVHNAATYPNSVVGRINDSFLARYQELLDAGEVLDVIDEDTFERFGNLEKGGLRIGNCLYEKVYLDEAVRFTSEGMQLVRDCSSILGNSEQGKLYEKTEYEIDREKGGRVDIRWNSLIVEENGFLLEFESEGDGLHAARFEWENGVDLELRVLFADRAVAASLNDRELSLSNEVDGTQAELGPCLKAGKNELKVRFANSVESPFAWLKGNFRVRWEDVCLEGDGGLASCSGTAALCGSRELDIDPRVEFCLGGFSFARGPFVAEGDFELRESAASFSLEGIQADAARIYIDGKDYGWLWGPDWRWTMDSAIPKGRYSARLELVPSTYNFYGPQRYFGGDRHVISPDQFRGRRNFADPAVAPEFTLTDRWHFVPSRLPLGLSAFYEK